MKEENIKKQKNIKEFTIVFFTAFFAVKVSVFLQGILFNLCNSAGYGSNFLTNENSGSEIFFNSFISTGLIEESVKLFFFFILYFFCLKTQPSTKRQERKKILILALFFGFVFALFENLAYAVQDIYSIRVRIFTATILHTTISLYYWKIIFEENKSKKIKAFISAWLLHGFYNLFLTVNIYFAIFSVLILIYLVLKVFQFFSSENFASENLSLDKDKI